MIIAKTKQQRNKTSRFASGYRKDVEQTFNREPSVNSRYLVVKVVSFQCVPEHFKIQTF